MKGISLFTDDPAKGTTVTYVISKSRFKTHIRQMTETEFAAWVADPTIVCNLGTSHKCLVRLILTQKES